ncbi:MAG: UPF0489 family protein [Oscillospiraceae bacterium]|nr:UPF0489 family protein [Oscillospiraceae bacterium]
MIPVFRMEEHCEAYAIWHIAIDEGIIAPTGNLLLHVDHHDDLDDGPYRHDFTAPVTDAAQALDMVRNVLGIADFIVPAFWEEIFDRMINFKSIFSSKKEASEKIVQLRKGNDLCMRDPIGLVDSDEDENRESKKVVLYEELSLMKPLPIEQPVVLDIDLDYFCFDNSLSIGEAPKLEITREAYEAFLSQPRHPLRILARRMIYVEQEGDRYFFVLRMPAPPKRVTREERIRQRVDKFFAWLKENEIRPVLIDICRSRISGYCPSDRWELVEELVLKGLDELYGIELRDDMFTLL